MRCFHVWLLVHLPCFPCVCPLFRCLLLFAILAAPFIFPFQFVPLLQCVFHAFLVCVFCPVVSTFPCPPVPPPFLRPLPFSFLSFLCVRLLTHALYFPCVPFVPVLLPLCRPFCPSFSVLGLSVPLVLFLCFLCACFQPRCPHLPGAIPPFSPPPFPPLPPSFPRFPSPILRSFPLLRFPLRKKFPLKSCMISSVKYMFYSIFLVCLGKFF